MVNHNLCVDYPLLKNSSILRELQYSPFKLLLVYKSYYFRFLKGSFPVIIYYIFYLYQSRWPRGLRRAFVAARLLGLWVRIPPDA